MLTHRAPCRVRYALTCPYLAALDERPLPVPSPVSRYGAAVAAVLLAATALSACSDSDKPTAAPSSPSTTTTATTPPVNVPGPMKTKTAIADPVDVAIDVQIAKGKVTSNQPNARAKIGDRVLLRVVSDVADEVHVHGIDKSLKLAATVPGSLIFVVKQKGTFEIETHMSKKVLSKLAVS